MTAFHYVGNELELFARATNWKSYISKCIRPYIKSAVLEVGAGIGETTSALSTQNCEDWCCLEPDAKFCELIQRKIENGSLPKFCRIRNGTTESFFSSKETFQTILYLDVIEHIKNDAAELARAAQLLRPEGNIIILAPAHNFLFSNFDRAVGHYRRYNKQLIRQICPPSLKITQMRYLDSIGLLASLANRLLLRQGIPTLRQVMFWDSILVRASTILDPILLYHYGKSILAVMRKRGSKDKT